VLELRGALRFANAAVDAGVATAPASYTLRWFRFDNATDTRRNVGAALTTERTGAEAPAALLEGSDEYVGVSVTAQHPQQPAWARPATFYFRRGQNEWTLVGVER
jgi:hypothetical protein